MIIDPIRARRMAQRNNQRLRTKIMRQVMAPFNRKAASFPENPAYAERIKLSETEIKTLHDAIREVLFPEHKTIVHREAVGPESTALGSYMRDRIAQSVITNARAKRKVE